MIKRYSELITLKSFESRFNYLKLSGVVGAETFGHDRYLNQIFYKSDAWLKARDAVITRDLGCDLGVEGFEIKKFILVHHINPITVDDILGRKPFIYDPEFLITTCKKTHRSIHYGDDILVSNKPVIRTKNDTCPWRIS